MLEPKYLTARSLAVRLVGAPHETLVLAISTQLSGNRPSCLVTSAVVVTLDGGLVPTSVAALESNISFHERLLFRQRQWCDIVVYLNEEDDADNELLFALYHLLMYDKFEALETLPPDILADAHDKGVYLLSGGLDAFRDEYPLLCDFSLEEEADVNTLGDYSPAKLTLCPTLSKHSLPRAMKTKPDLLDGSSPHCLSVSPVMEQRLGCQGQSSEAEVSSDDDSFSYLRPELPSTQERLRAAHQRVFRSLQSSQFFKAEPPSQVMGHLYLGSAQNAAMWRQLKALNVTHVLVVGTECKAFFPGHFQYLHCNVLDQEDDIRIKDYFDPAFDFIEAARLAGTAVLVHCFCGISRSAALVLSYLMRAKQVSLADALVFLQFQRPRVNPNRGFMDCLVNYDQELHRRRGRRWSSSEHISSLLQVAADP